MKQIKIGFVGVGLIGYDWHIKRCLELPEKFKINAVCDLNEDMARQVADECDCPFYVTATEMFAEADVDLVVIGVPGALHRDLSIEAMQAGKDVIVEKPMALNVREVDEMIAMAEQTGRRLFVHHNRRWDGDFLAVRDVVQAGKLGEVFLIESKAGKFSRVRGKTVGENIDWRLTKKFGGGRLNEWGPHLIDQILLIAANNKPVSVFADLQSRCWNKDAEDHVNLIIRFEDGLLAKIEISQSCRILLFPRWFVCGTKGTLCSRYKGPTAAKQEMTYVVADDVDNEESFDVEIPDYDLSGFYNNIHAVIAEGAEEAIKLQDVRRVMAIIDAARQSNDTGQVVFLK